MFLYPDTAPPRSFSFRLAQSIFERNFFPYKYPNNLILVILPAYIVSEDGTVCSETSAYKIQTLGNRPKERTQHSERGEILKSKPIDNISKYSTTTQLLYYQFS